MTEHNVCSAEGKRSTVRAKAPPLTVFLQPRLGLHAPTQSDRQRVREVFGADKYARLAAIKARYDPDNVLHHAANIAPRRQRTT
jgi:hypothetical protein